MLHNGVGDHFLWLPAPFFYPTSPDAHNAGNHVLKMQADPEIDWLRFEEGICCATTWWMLDSSRADELPLDIDLAMGNLDGMFADQYDPVTGENLGWQLFPEDYANIILHVMERKEKG